MEKRMKPLKRSKLRLYLGKRYFTMRKHLEWILNSEKYSDTISDQEMDHVIFQHKTPLRRNLKNVERAIDDNKIINLSIAIKTIDGIIIKPNEIFSYWRLIGQPRKSKGYVDGMVLDHGKYKIGIGGGLCQLSNMIFWMMSHTPLEVVERHRHSYDVFPDSNRTQPFGSGATCVYNYRDLQILNSTNETYQIRVWMDSEFLHGKILSNQEKYLNINVYEASHHISHEFWGGYLRHNVIKRKIFDLSRRELEDQIICENHAIMMYSPLLNKPTDFN